MDCLLSNLQVFWPQVYQWLGYRCLLSSAVVRRIVTRDFFVSCQYLIWAPHFYLFNYMVFISVKTYLYLTTFSSCTHLEYSVFCYSPLFMYSVMFNLLNGLNQMSLHAKSSQLIFTSQTLKVFKRCLVADYVMFIRSF